MTQTKAVYKIAQRNTGRVYVGSTINIANRWSTHISELIHGNHTAGQLQNDVNRYGISSLSFEVLEFLPYSSPAQLRQREAYWMSKFKLDGYELYNGILLTHYSKVHPDVACALCENPIYEFYLCQECFYYAMVRLDKIKMIKGLLDQYPTDKILLNSLAELRQSHPVCGAYAVGKPPESGVEAAQPAPWLCENGHSGE